MNSTGLQNRTHNNIVNQRLKKEQLSIQETENN